MADMLEVGRAFGGHFARFVDARMRVRQRQEKPDRGARIVWRGTWNVFYDFEKQEGIAECATYTQTNMGTFVRMGRYMDPPEPSTGGEEEEDAAEGGGCMLRAYVRLEPGYHFTEHGVLHNVININDVEICCECHKGRGFFTGFLEGLVDRFAAENRSAGSAVVVSNISNPRLKARLVKEGWGVVSTEDRQSVFRLLRR